MDSANEEIKWYLRPWVVIVSLFFVLGPLALPLLYLSPKFNKTSKVVLTIVTVVYTGYLIWATMETIESLSKNIPLLRAALGLE